MKSTTAVIVRFLFGLMLLTLAACGGGGGGSSTSAAGSTVTPGTVSGKITLDTAGGAGLGQVSVAVNGVGSQFTDGNGIFEVTGVANGTYTVTPSRAGYTFTPASQTVTVSNNAVVANFVAAAIPTYAVSGTVASANGAGIGGAAVKVVDKTGATVVQLTDGSGNYSVSGLLSGDYTVSVSHPDGYTFTPASTAVTIGSSGATANFSAAVATYVVSGKVATASAAGVAGVTLLLTAQSGASYTATSDAGGNYTLSGVPDGYYSLTPGLNGYNFVPNPFPVQVSGAAVTGKNITAAPTASGGGSLTISF